MVLNTLIRRFLNSNAPVAILLVLLLVSLYLLRGATHNSLLFGRLYTVLLAVNAAAILIMLLLIGKSLWHLVQQYREHRTGSRLTTRLVVMFVILSVTPVSVVYYFSLDFLRRGIDSWFDVRVENALNDALELSQASLGVRMRELLRHTRQMGSRLNGVANELASLTLSDILKESDASEIALFAANGLIIAASSSETSRLLPQQLEDTTLQQLRQDKPEVGLIPIQDAGLHVRVAINIPSSDNSLEPRILQILFPVTERINTLADSVQNAFSQYREIAYLRYPLKYSFILALSLVLLLSILASIWAAFFAARRLVAPISDLVEGTRAVAAGNYEKRLPLPGKDELGFLVRSFNDMTHKIALAQDSARLSQQQAEAQHAYLEAVLGNLSSGVITLNGHMQLQTSNAAADHILGLKLVDLHEQFIDELVTQLPHLQQFVDSITPHLQHNEDQWQEEIVLFSGGNRKILMCRGTRLPDNQPDNDGMVIVFDDITEFVQAQRNAAWGEVARRLAHEIKNPLTPIQLAAERLRHKYLDKMDSEDAAVLDRSTHTIVQQVETMKQMVKAFSDYARMPTLHLDTVNLHQIINEVLDLYHETSNQQQFRVKLDTVIPLIQADIGRLRQLLHNLIKNALEANEESGGETVYIVTRCAEEHACRYVELKITDTGPGISDDMLGQVFEPYVTTKPKGSGLGLAIVKKIVEEHGGMIWAENAPEGGASIIIRLPVKGSEEKPAQQEQNRDNDHAAA